MRKFCLIVILAFGLTASVAFSQATNLAETYKMVPKAGMSSQVESALKAHAEWRIANGDSWTWNLYQEIVGHGFGTFYARSGGHSWADFDEYDLPGSSAHFNQTVTPLLESLSNTITAVDTTVINWPDEDEFTLFQIINYDLKPGGGMDFSAAIKKYHSAIMEKNDQIHYVFAWTVFGNDGTEDVAGVFPQNNWGGFAPSDPAVEQIMIEVYGEEEAGKIRAQLGGSFRSTTNSVLLYRPDLSVTSAE